MCSLLGVSGKMQGAEPQKKEPDIPIVEHPLKKKNENPDYCTSECVIRAIVHIVPVWEYRRD